MQQARRKYPALCANLRIIQNKTHILRVRLEGSVCKSAEPVPFDGLSKALFRPAKQVEAWGRAYACMWLKLSGKVPDDLKKPYLLIRNTGESLLYTQNGIPFDAVTSVWTNGDLPQSAGAARTAALPFAAGERFTLYADCGYNGFIPMDFSQGMFRGAWIAERNEGAFAYYYDYLALLLLAGATRDEALAKTLADALKRSFKAFGTGDVALARELLTPHLTKPSEDAFVYTAIGHGHLDLAWLWPIRETIRKAARTYSIALRNIERYPWYIYGTSQPQQLLWMKQHYPTVFEGVRKAIASGRIEPQGGFYAECDTNLPSGESLIRQALYGKRAWREEFGHEAHMCWLPDAFGYSGNLPQILKKCGMDYFSTIKLSWNKVNVFPYRTFYWQGIDGSRVLVHMPPEGDYNSAAGAHNLLAGVARDPEKELNAALLVYGSGDGGGGPAERHIELVQRERSLYGLPQAKPGRAIDFFDDLAQREIAHSYAGELYLETHQGTYTTQGRTKHDNRLMERLLHEAEAALAMKGGAAGFQQALDDLWREVLLYQFHDIIPGSSIGRVYRETVPRYRAMESALNSIIEEALVSSNAKEAVSVAVNLTAFARDEYVKHEGKWYRAVVPPYAAKRLVDAAGQTQGLIAAKDVLSNGILTLTFGNGCEIVSCKDHSGRALSGGYLNRLMLYQDRFVYPFNAWDIDRKYHQRSARSLRAASSETFTDGPRVVRRSVYRFGKSKVVQDVILEARSDTVRFETHADWHETFKMLRADFRPADYGDMARFDIQFGSIERATTEKNSVETAQFEVCAHKYAAVQGQEGGFALLNDCKYGHRVKNGLLSLNLLRSPVFPDPRADKGEHDFIYAFCPFERDDFGKAVREGYRLNNPLRIVAGEEQGSFVACDNPHIVIETVKRAENGAGVVLRLYEALGKAARAGISTAFSFDRALYADMLENPEGEADLTDLCFTPYEVKTILLIGGAV